MTEDIQYIKKEVKDLVQQSKNDIKEKRKNTLLQFLFNQEKKCYFATQIELQEIEAKLTEYNRLDALIDQLGEITQ